VAEMSRPSSVEVEDIIHQLVQNILRRFLLEDASSNFIEQSVEDYHTDSDDEFSDTIATSRDYLAKLLFWSVNLIVYTLTRTFPRCCMILAAIINSNYLDKHKHLSYKWL
jgi:hypothetical protein